MGNVAGGGQQPGYSPQGGYNQGYTPYGSQSPQMNQQAPPMQPQMNPAQPPQMNAPAPGTGDPNRQDFGKARPNIDPQ
jgi:hypothetical protein